MAVSLGVHFLCFGEPHEEGFCLRQRRSAMQPSVRRLAAYAGLPFPLGHNPVGVVKRGFLRFPNVSRKAANVGL
jgi:hypothetical protein